MTLPVEFDEALILSTALTIMPAYMQPEREVARKKLQQRIDDYIRKEISDGNELGTGRERPQ